MFFTPLLQGAAQQQAGPATYRPAADVVTTGWAASSGSNLFAMLDEPVASDDDYIISPAISGSPAPAVFALNDAMPPGAYTFSVRARSTGSSGDIRASFLDGSSTSVGDSPWQSLTGSSSIYALPVTTSANAVRLRLEVRETPVSGGSLYLNGSLLYLNAQELSLNGPSTSLPAGSLYLDTNLLYLDSNIVSLT